MSADKQTNKTQGSMMYCRKCQYILNNLADNRCPECGQAFEPDDEKTFYTSIPKIHPYWAIFWLVLACLGFATGGEILWTYKFGRIFTTDSDIYYITWSGFWTLLAVFAVIHAVKLLGNWQLWRLWIHHIWVKRISRVFSTLWAIGIFYWIAMGPIAFLHTGNYLDYSIFIITYLHIHEIGVNDTVTTNIAYGYINLCSKSIWKIRWQESTDYAIKGEYQKALDAITNLYGPNISYRRAQLYVELGDLKNAMLCIESAVSFSNDKPFYIAYRGYIYFKSGRYESAIEDCNMAIRFKPELIIAHNIFARILATCPDDEYRDGEKAVEHATKACELAQWESSSCITTLATAYAEVGNFNKAIEMIHKAFELNPDFEVELQQEMMENFENHRPYREGNKNK